MPMKYPEEFIIQTVKQHEAGVPIKRIKPIFECRLIHALSLGQGLQNHTTKER